jgi:hypothetical protein
VFRLVSETVRPADHIDNNVTTERTAAPDVILTDAVCCPVVGGAAQAYADIGVFIESAQPKSPGR